jgi:hypothetical protein
MEGCCEYGNEPLGCIKCWEFPTGRAIRGISRTQLSSGIAVTLVGTVSKVRTSFRVGPACSLFYRVTLICTAQSAVGTLTRAIYKQQPRHNRSPVQTC